MIHRTYHENRLSFGVPLEDVFPSEDIHPGLKNLLLESYKNIVKHCYSIEEILNHGSFQGTLQERLKLKDRLVILQKFEGLKISPGAPLWVIRHFLGLLPTPLLPQYGNGKIFLWGKLSEQCKISLANYVTRRSNNPKLLKKIAGELKRLPSSNLILVTSLLDFLRMLAVLPNGEPRINKSAVFAMVKYFTSSLFLRPFRPGWVIKEEKKYYPLMLYLILKWPEIQKIYVEYNKPSYPLSIEEVYPRYNDNLVPGYPLYISKSSKNGTTQTASAPLQIIKQNENNTLIRIIPPSYHEFSHLKDTACQTDNFIDYHADAIPKREKVVFIRKNCYCTYSTNYETNKGPKENKEFSIENDDLLFQNNSDFESNGWKLNSNLDINYSNSKKYGWKYNENLDISYSNNSVDTKSLAGSEFIESANYLDDDYSKCNLISDTENLEGSHTYVNTSELTRKESQQLFNQALKGKISKIGWTYTPPTEKKVPASENNGCASGVSYNTPQEDYKLTYGVRRSLNEELKEKLTELKIREKYEDEIEKNYEDDDADLPVELTTSNSKLHLPEKCESKKSLIKIAKMKSKLDFLKKFGTKKGKAKNSFSDELMQSGVKYEKMGSVNSLL